MRNLFYNKGGYSHSAREYEKRYGGCWRNPAALLYKKECVLGVDTFRACLKNHSRNLHAPLCGIFCPNSVAVARYGALIRTKSPTNCDAHLAESLFQTRSRQMIVYE